MRIKAANTTFLTIKRENIVTIVEYLVIAALIFFDARTFTHLYLISDNIQLVVRWGGIAFLIFEKFRRESMFKINNKTVVIFMILISNIFLSVLINNDTSNKWVQIVVMLVYSFLLVNTIPYKEWAKIYVNIMYFLSVYSIAIFVFALISPSVFMKIFPTFQHVSTAYFGGHIDVYSAGLSCVYFGEKYLRNFGPFSEPGFYQFFILTALVVYVNTFNSKEDKKYYIKIVTFIIAAYSTLSVIGIICTTIVVIGLFLSNEKNAKYKKYILISLAILILASKILGLSDAVTKVFSKFEGGDSLNSRYGSLIGSIQSWLERPLLGWSYTNAILGAGALYLEYSTHMTNTTFFMFSCYGLVFGFIYFIGQLMCIYNRHRSLIWSIFAIIGFFVSLNGETYFGSLFGYVVMTYGYSKYISREKNEKN